ncbi:hypothetical protein OHC33_009384 [Knufia fluminis]|uniref:Transcription factor CBF/NF-Y/archaeal histone domain-containing protein n=1 Tax=Knufia fluminis TaxID=191047 RepID=A0AAN8I1Q3_9EURO|nr:hypothetical protein OHC33_009384 [Knufia fluminis]
MNDNRSPGHTKNSQIPQDYRPRSPDLSGFVAPPPPRLSRLPSIPYSQDPSLPQGYSFSPRGSYDASPYFSPQTTQPPAYFGNQSQQSPYPSGNQQQYFTEPQAFSPSPYHDDMARLRNRPQVNYNDDHPANEFDDRVMPQQRIPPQPQPILAAREPIMPMPMQQLPQQVTSFQQHQQPLAPLPTLDQAQQPQQFQSSETSSIPRCAIETKFPVARIKRIMQADEDIGKVAQATPTAVAKALECFMIALVNKGAITAQSQNSKRVTATHLKTALLEDPQYDFLNEICENVADEAARKPKVKGEPKSEESEDEDIGGGPKKRKAGAGGGGRKRKAGGNKSD